MSKENHFSAFDARTEVSDKIISVVVSAARECGVDLGVLQERHGLTALRPDGWHNQQQFLHFLKDVSALGLVDLMGLGSSIPARIACPCNSASIVEMLDWLRLTYQECHRAGDAGYYETIQVDLRRIRVISHTPYPEILEYGLCWGLARQFAPPGTHSLVTACHTMLPFPGVNEEYTVYAITW